MRAAVPVVQKDDDRSRPIKRTDCTRAAQRRRPAEGASPETSQHAVRSAAGKGRACDGVDATQEERGAARGRPSSKVSKDKQSAKVSLSLPQVSQASVPETRWRVRSSLSGMCARTSSAAGDVPPRACMLAMYDRAAVRYASSTLMSETSTARKPIEAEENEFRASSATDVNHFLRLPPF